MQGLHDLSSPFCLRKNKQNKKPVGLAILGKIFIFKFLIFSWWHTSAFCLVLIWLGFFLFLSWMT